MIESDDNNDILQMEEASSKMLPAIPILDFGLTLVFVVDENCLLKLCLVYRVRLKLLTQSNGLPFIIWL